LKGRLKLSDTERATLAEIGHRLGRKNAFAHRYNHCRPYNALGGRTPNEYLIVMSQETRSSQMC
jgi:hypothetical protein